MRSAIKRVTMVGALGAALALLTFNGVATAGSATPTGTGNTMHVAEPLRPEASRPGNAGGGGRNPNLYFHGGTPTAVETAPAVYVVYWGSQWTSNDPTGEAAYLEAFFSGLYGSTDGLNWTNSTREYCQGVPAGTYDCTKASAPVFVGLPSGSLLKGAAWHDNGAAAPAHPSQTQLAAEALNAVAHFGVNDLANAQFVIATAHNNSASGFGTQYCAWHSSTTTSAGARVAYTNLPYISDAGGSCGAGFVNPGNAKDGISIVEGHEFAETVTDAYPNGGWLDGGGAENGDKCAWKAPGTTGGSHNLVLTTGTFAVQTLWSNAISGCAG